MRKMKYVIVDDADFLKILKSKTLTDVRPTHTPPSNRECEFPIYLMSK